MKKRLHIQLTENQYDYLLRLAEQKGINTPSLAIGAALDELSELVPRKPYTVNYLAPDRLKNGLVIAQDGSEKERSEDDPREDVIEL